MKRFLFLLCMSCSSDDHPPPPASQISQPYVVCGTDAGVDAGDAGDAAFPSYVLPECPPPRSACVDSKWQAYFDQGRCVENRCVWEMKFYRCTNDCLNGACLAGGSGV